MKKIFPAISISALVLLTACTQNDSSNTSAPAENETTAYIYEGQYKMFDPDVIKEIFIPELDSLGDDDFDLEHTKIGTGSVRIDDPELGAGLYHLYTLKDGSSLFWDAGTIVFENNLEGECAAMNISKFEVTPTEEQVREEYPLWEIEGLSSEETLAMAQDIMDKLDIPYIGEPQIYTCAGEESYCDGINTYPTKDAYYVLYPTVVDGVKLPYTYTYFSGMGWEGRYGYAQFLFSADGLEYFDAEWIFDYQRKENCRIISQEQAAEIMKNTIERASEIGETSISEGKLTYVANTDMNTGSSLLYPAWEFIKYYEMEFPSEGGSTVTKQCFQRIYIDAQSGDILS